VQHSENSGIAKCTNILQLKTVNKMCSVIANNFANARSVPQFTDEIFIGDKVHQV